MKKKEVEVVKLPEVYGGTPGDFNGVGIPGLTAQQLMRTKDKAMYKRWDGVYEVFRIKIQGPTNVFGKIYPSKERYPSSEEFGSIAWCFNNYDLAKAEYDAI
jgi:hypothetical protein